MTSPPEYRRTPLHEAVIDEDIAQVRALAATSDVNARDFADWTPLHFAAQAGSPDMVNCLLDAGADIDAVTEKGYPALYFAIISRGDAVATVRLLRQRGADPRKATMRGYFGLSSPLDFVREMGNKPDVVAEFKDLL